MTNEKFDLLVKEVITRNGTGEQFLTQLVEDQEISVAEEKKILLAAKISILTKKVEQLCNSLD